MSTSLLVKTTQNHAPTNINIVPIKSVMVNRSNNKKWLHIAETTKPKEPIGNETVEGINASATKSSTTPTT